MTSNTKTTTDTIPAHLGLATLLRLNMAGADLSPLGQALIARASEDPTDACSLLDAGIICQFHGQPVLAQHLQNEALNMQQHYCLPAQRPCRLRLLALVVPGDLMANVPLECLLEDADVELNLYYTLGTTIAYQDLPAHDVLFVAIGGSTANTPTLETWAKHLENWPKPVLNRPAMIAHLARDTAGDLLQDIPGLLMPKTQRIAHQTLLHSAQNNQLPNGLSYPLIVRPIDSHAGHDVNKIDNAAELISALAEITEDSLFVAPLIVFHNPYGLFRKDRIVLINDAAFACHMGISGKGMKEENGVIFSSIQGAIGFIAYSNRPEDFSGIQFNAVLKIHILSFNDSNGIRGIVSQCLLSFMCKSENLNLLMRVFKKDFYK